MFLFLSRYGYLRGHEKYLHMRHFDRRLLRFCTRLFYSRDDCDTMRTGKLAPFTVFTLSIDLFVFVFFGVVIFILHDLSLCDRLFSSSSKNVVSHPLKSFMMLLLFIFFVVNLITLQVLLQLTTTK